MDLFRYSSTQSRSTFSGLAQLVLSSSDQDLKVVIAANTAGRSASATMPSSQPDPYLPIVVSVNAIRRNIFAIKEETTCETNISYEVVLVDPASISLRSLKTFLLEVFLTGSTYRAGGNVVTTKLEGLSDVRDLYLHWNDGLKIWIHEGNLQAALRLVGESRGELVLHVTLK